jgi:ribosome-associated protein
MISITSTLSLDESELHYEFVRSSGPGGQNVNKVSSAVELRFNIIRSNSLPFEVKDRLVKLAGKRVTDGGDLIIDAQVYRTQEQNKADALRRLIGLIQKAAEVPKVRRATRPSGAGRARDKQHRSEIKKIRRDTPGEWD